MNVEYDELAKYYDLLYTKKSYSKELDFLKEIIKDRKKILDAGCGTGTHMKLLEDNGYDVTGFDLSSNMLDVAKGKVKGKLNNGNIIDYNDNNKYDAIISMFAVFNHLDNYKDFKTAVLNLLESLNPNGLLIIDLHNGRKSGEKIDKYGSIKRRMKWEFKKFREETEITYTINDKEYYGGHKFLIYQINKLEKILKDFNYAIYENYSFNKATEDSKNLQIVIKR